jgi:hypothetical protein
MDHDAARSAQPGAADAWLGERAQLAQLEAELDVQLVVAWLGVVSSWMEVERDAIPIPPVSGPPPTTLSSTPYPVSFPDPQTVGLPLSVFYIMFRHMCLARTRTRTRTALLCAMFPSLPLRNLCITYGVVALAMELSRHGCFVCLIWLLGIASGVEHVACLLASSVLLFLFCMFVCKCSFRGGDRVTIQSVDGRCFFLVPMMLCC